MDKELSNVGFMVALQQAGVLKASFCLGACPTIKTCSIFAIWSVDGAAPPIHSSFLAARSS